MKGSSLKLHQDHWVGGRASDVDHAYVSWHDLLLCRENNCSSLGRAGFQTPQLTVFGKIGCQSALYLGESFCLEGTVDVVGIDKPAAVSDRKVVGI